MKVKDIGESAMIDRICHWIGKAGFHPRGLGDDAAVLAGDGRTSLLLATDMIVEGVDFRSSEDPELIGRKALAINLSDMAAMGGIPCHAVVGIGMPSKTRVEWVRHLYEGILKLARRWRVTVVGGDLSKAPAVFVSVTVLGKVPRGRAVFRKGSRPGDWIFVTGNLGGSLLGKHLTFVPRIAESQWITKHLQVHAMIDVSDGLVQDLFRLLKTDRLGAKVFLSRIPVSKEAYQLARRHGRSALESALSDGEDFELLFTASPRMGEKILRRRGRVAGTSVSCIGEITEKPGQIDFFESEFSPKPITLGIRGGYEHFK